MEEQETATTLVELPANAWDIILSHLQPHHLGALRLCSRPLAAAVAPHVRAFSVPLADAPTALQWGITALAPSPRYEHLSSVSSCRLLDTRARAAANTADECTCMQLLAASSRQHFALQHPTARGMEQLAASVLVYRHGIHTPEGMSLEDEEAPCCRDQRHGRWQQRLAWALPLAKLLALRWGSSLVSVEVPDVQLLSCFTSTCPWLEEVQLVLSSSSTGGGDYLVPEEAVHAAAAAAMAQCLRLLAGCAALRRLSCGVVCASDAAVASALSRLTQLHELQLTISYAPGTSAAAVQQQGQRMLRALLRLERLARLAVISTGGVLNAAGCIVDPVFQLDWSTVVEEDESAGDESPATSHQSPMHAPVDAAAAGALNAARQQGPELLGLVQAAPQALQSAAEAAAAAAPPSLVLLLAGRLEVLSLQQRGSGGGHNLLMQAYHGGQLWANLPHVATFTQLRQLRLGSAMVLGDADVGHLSRCRCLEELECGQLLLSHDCTGVLPHLASCTVLVNLGWGPSAMPPGLLARVAPALTTLDVSACHPTLLVVMPTGLVVRADDARVRAGVAAALVGHTRLQRLALPELHSELLGAPPLQTCVALKALSFQALPPRLCAVEAELLRGASQATTLSVSLLGAPGDGVSAAHAGSTLRGMLQAMPRVRLLEVAVDSSDAAAALAALATGPGGSECWACFEQLHVSFQQPASLCAACAADALVGVVAAASTLRQLAVQGMPSSALLALERRCRPLGVEVVAS